MKWLIIHSNEHYMSVPLDAVVDMRPAFAATPVPFTQASLDGLINREGIVSRQWDLAALAGGEPLPWSVSQTAIVLTQNGQTHVIRAEGFDAVVVAPRDEPIHWVAGLVKRLDLDSLRVQPSQSLNKNLRDIRAHSTATIPTPPSSDRLSFIVLGIGERKFALCVSDVVDVARMPPLTQLPGAPESVLGTAVMEYGPITVFGLGILLGIPEANETTLGRLIVVDVGGSRYGFGISGAMKLQHFHRSAKANAQFAEFVTELLIDPQGEVIGILELAKLIAQEQDEPPVETKELANPQVPSAVQRERFLSLLVQGERWLVAAEHVVTAAGERRVSWIPFATNLGLANGLVEVMGEVLPLRDLTGEGPSHTDAEVVVLEIESQKWAFAVNGVGKIWELETDSVRPVKDSAGVHLGVVRANNRLWSVVDPPSLVRHNPKAGE